MKTSFNQKHPNGQKMTWKFYQVQTKHFLEFITSNTQGKFSESYYQTRANAVLEFI